MTTRLDLLLINASSARAVYGPLAELAAIETPVWATLLATYCRTRGLSVQILDAEAEGISTDETAKRIFSLEPRLAAFCVYGHQPSASTQSMPSAIRVAKELRELEDFVYRRTRIQTMVLGTHASALPKRTLMDSPQFDYVCEGEGQTTIIELLRGNLNAPGLHRRGQSEGAVFWHESSAPAAPAPGLDVTFPTQSFDLLNMRRYRPHNWHLWTGHRDGGYASVQTSLGCPYSCSFCCINAPFGGKGYRRWSPANVAARIANLMIDYGITNIKIPDEMFVLNRQHVWQICGHLIDMKLGDALNIWAYARVDTVKDQALLDRMRRAGFRWLGIGIESGSKHVRDGVEKGRFGNEEIIESVRRVQRAGILVGANYILGLPDDTQHSIGDTLALAVEINAEWANFYCAMAYPGSPLHTQAKEQGWQLPEDPGGPGWIGYSQHAYETLPLRTAALEAAEVLALRDYAHMAYFSRNDYQSMLRERVGQHAVDEVRRMIDLGMPRRRLLEVVA